MGYRDKKDKEKLERFFDVVEHIAQEYLEFTSEAPKYLYINPDLIAYMSRIEGFYQRPELGSEVTSYAPIVRYFRLKTGVVTIIEDFDEKFLHFGG